MTDRPTASEQSVAAGASRSAPPRRPVTGKPGVLPTLLASGACFLVLFEFLAFQLRSGNDPALGAGTQGAAQEPRRPTVIDRKLIKTRVVHEVPAPAAPPAAGTPVSGGSVGATSPTAAPAASSPAPTPAPPPPVTSSS
jgi:hypothetical protein